MADKRSLFIRLRDMLISNKVYLARSMTYIAMLNAAMILFLMLSKLQDYGIEIYITRWFFPIMLVGLVAMVAIGYLDERLGFFAQEQRRVGANHPVFNEMLDRLRRIEKRLDEIEKKRR